MSRGQARHSLAHAARARAPSRHSRRWTGPRAVAAGFAAAACALALAGCAPHAGLLRHPLAVHLADRPEGAETRRIVQWCDADGVCHVAPEVVLDERDVRHVGLDRGEGRVTLQLTLNERGRARLGVVAQGAGAGGRLTVVVDDRALEASRVEAAYRDGRVTIDGPADELDRLYQRLTEPSQKAPPRD